MRRLASLLCAAPLLAATPALGMTLELVSPAPTLHVVADDGIGTAVQVDDSPGFDLPAVLQPEAVDGGSRSLILHQQRDVFLADSYDQEIAAGPDSRAESSGSMTFRPLTEVAFFVDGGGNSRGAIETYFEVELRDLTDDTTLLRNVQHSTSTPIEDFDLGGLGGDADNEFFTTLALVASGFGGTLFPDHDYRLSFRTFIHGTAPDSPSATAGGSLGLPLLPEPALAPLLGLACAAIAGTLDKKARSRLPTT